MPKKFTIEKSIYRKNTATPPIYSNAIVMSAPRPVIIKPPL
jgi:hypothetical protein